MKTKEKTYQEALNEIETIIKSLENGETDIDEMTEKVKQASALIRLCKNKLHTIESELAKALDDNEG